MEPTELSVHAHVAPIPDPRKAWNQDHRRLDILVLALCAIFSGADSAVRVATFAQAKLPWFRRLLDLPLGHRRTTPFVGSLPPWTPRSCRARSSRGGRPCI